MKELKLRKIKCPICEHDNEVYGNGFYGSYECTECHNWFNVFGQIVIPPEEQIQCEDW